MIPGLILQTCLLLSTPDTPWPGDAGVEIGQIGQPGGLGLGYEPSGAAWHAGLQRLVIVGDDGDVSVMQADGSNITSWFPGGDLEAVAVPDPQDTLVWLGCENCTGVQEFDLATGTLTGNAWDLTAWMGGPINQRLEALTVVSGLAYAGHQGSGDIFVFDLQPAGAVLHIATLPSPFGRTDLAGLHYDEASCVLYAVYDTDNVIVEMTADGTFIREYTLPGNNQEGITLVPDCDNFLASVFISQDDGEVWRYGNYPVTCTWASLGLALAGTLGDPELGGEGCLAGGDPVTLSLTNALPNTSAFMVIGATLLLAPFRGGTLVPAPDFVSAAIPTGAAGQVVAGGTWPLGLPGATPVHFQCWTIDPGGPMGFAASNGLVGTTPP